MKSILSLAVLACTLLAALPAQWLSAEASDVRNELNHALPGIDASWELGFEWRGSGARPQLMATFHPQGEESAEYSPAYIVTQYHQENSSLSLEARVMRWLDCRAAVLKSMESSEILYSKADKVFVGEWSGELDNGEQMRGIFLAEMRNGHDRLLLQYNLPTENPEQLAQFREAFLSYAKTL